MRGRESEEVDLECWERGKLLTQGLERYLRASTDLGKEGSRGR